jgi:hypothetical protein
MVSSAGNFETFYKIDLLEIKKNSKGFKEISAHLLAI